MKRLFLLLFSLILVTLLIINAPAADQYASDAHWFGYSRQELIYETPYAARVACSEWESSTRDVTKRSCEWVKMSKQFLGRKALDEDEYKVIKRFRY